MKASELRIGNWISFCPLDSRKAKEIQIDSTYFGAIEQHSFMAKPIPLTEKWVRKFGYKYDKGIEIWETSDNKFINLRKVDDYFMDYESYYGLQMKIKYVHQLQNIYFMLREKELK